MATPDASPNSPAGRQPPSAHDGPAACFQVGQLQPDPLQLIPCRKIGFQHPRRGLRVAYEATGMPAVAPSELSAVLHAPTEMAREDAWTTFLHAYTDQILRIVRSLRGDHDILMDRYT